MTFFVLEVNTVTCTCISVLGIDHKTKGRLAKEVLLTSVTISELSSS